MRDCTSEKAGCVRESAQEREREQMRARHDSLSYESLTRMSHSTHYSFIWDMTHSCGTMRARQRKERDKDRDKDRDRDRDKRGEAAASQTARDIDRQPETSTKTQKDTRRHRKMQGRGRKKQTYRSKRD